VVEERDDIGWLLAIGGDDFDIASRIREQLVDEPGSARVDRVANNRHVNLGVAVVELVLVQDAVIAIPPIHLRVGAVGLILPSLMDDVEQLVELATQL
jgi:hypothetical protein